MDKVPKLKSLWSIIKLRSVGLKGWKLGSKDSYLFNFLNGFFYVEDINLGSEKVLGFIGIYFYVPNFLSFYFISFSFYFLSWAFTSICCFFFKVYKSCHSSYYWALLLLGVAVAFLAILADNYVIRAFLLRSSLRGMWIDWWERIEEKKISKK